MHPGASLDAIEEWENLVVAESRALILKLPVEILATASNELPGSQKQISRLGNRCVTSKCWYWVSEAQHGGVMEHFVLWERAVQG
jgi:hypothetical protein